MELALSLSLVRQQRPGGSRRSAVATRAAAAGRIVRAAAPTEYLANRSAARHPVPTVRSVARYLAYLLICDVVVKKLLTIFRKVYKGGVFT